MSTFGKEGDEFIERMIRDHAEITAKIREVFGKKERQEIPAPETQQAPSTSLNPEAPAFQPTNQRPGPGFGELPDGGDISSPEAWPSIQELVHKLLDPPSSAFPANHGSSPEVRITLQWVKKVVGEPHFVNNPRASRSVLKANSKIRSHGLSAGLPWTYYKWLCGPEENEVDPNRIDSSRLLIQEHEFRLVPMALRPSPPW